MTEPLLMSWRENDVAKILGTGYDEFISNTGICGLARESHERIDILAVVATEIGTGQFRRFIRACKNKYKTICIWEDWNPIVGQALSKYGFRRVTETTEDGERLEGWRYDA